jgi:hypothetical protein
LPKLQIDHANAIAPVPLRQGHDPLPKFAIAVCAPFL